MFELGVGAGQRLFLMETSIRVEKKTAGIPNGGHTCGLLPNWKTD